MGDCVGLVALRGGSNYYRERDRPGFQSMEKAQIKAAIWLVILLACWPCAFALDPSLDVSQYAHTSWKIREGFAIGTIHEIVQTPDGYLWLATESGLLRFDGVRTVAWQAPAGESLPSNDIRGLLVSRIRNRLKNTVRCGIVGYGTGPSHQTARRKRRGKGKIDAAGASAEVFAGHSHARPHSAGL